MPCENQEFIIKMTPTELIEWAFVLMLVFCLGISVYLGIYLVYSFVNRR